MTATVGRWVKVARLAELPENGTLLVALDDHPVALYNLHGRIYATDDACTHGQASLSFGDIQGENIECPLHQGLFHIPTGKAVGAPCTEDVKTYEINVFDGDVYLLADAK